MKHTKRLIPALTLALLGHLLVAGAAKADEMEADTEPSLLMPMSWTLQPGDSIKSLAKRVYPRDRHMQQHFVKEVMAMNRETLQGYTPSRKLETTVPIYFPDLKALSRYATPLRAQRAAEPAGAAAPAADARLQAAYESQMAHNEALKQQQMELDQRMAKLQAEIGELQRALAPSPAAGK